MGYARLSAVVLAGLLLAGCGGQDKPQAGSGEQSPTPTPTSAGPTPTPTLTPSPVPTSTPRPTTAPAVPVSGCSGTFKNGSFTLSGRQIFSSGSSFSCLGGSMIDVERLKTALRFSAGPKHITLGPKKSGTIGGYQIRVGLANSKQATFTIDRVKKA